MQAWSGDTVPVRYVHDATPLGRQGQIVFQEKQCRNCHMLGGVGGDVVRRSMECHTADL